MGHEKGLIFEYIWILMIIAVIAGFAASLAYYSFSLNVNPACKAYKATEDEIAQFQEQVNTQPVIEVAPGVYEVYIIGRQFLWQPSEIVLRDPKIVTFKVLSADVIHGFEIVGTNVNIMVFPGYIGELTWEVPSYMEGEYLIVCNEYCGVGHQFMYGKLVIERSEQALSGDSVVTENGLLVYLLP